MKKKQKKEAEKKRESVESGNEKQHVGRGSEEREKENKLIDIPRGPGRQW